MSATAAALADEHEALIQFLYMAPIGLVQTSADGAIALLNPVSAQLLMPLARDGVLVNLFTTLDRVAPEMRRLAQEFAPARGVICDALRIRIVHAESGRATPQVLSLGLYKLDETRLMAVIHDATQEVAREQQGLAQELGAAARFDELTRMPNRLVVLEQLREAMQKSPADAGYEFSLIYLNCDRLKLVNDSLGRNVGDQLLTLVADRLRATLRARGRDARSAAAAPPLAARIGGDEFVVLFGDLDPPDTVRTVAQRLVEQLAKPYTVGTHQLHCSVSAGIVQRASAAEDPDVVLQDASLAMAEAKRAGGSRYVIFEPTMHRRAAQRGGMEFDLHVALAETQLFVVYQPVVGLQHGSADGVDRHAGVEALVRWLHPTRGLVHPAEFIGVAEECGLIGAVGEFVLATACRDFVRWQAVLGSSAPRVLAVNLSRGQLKHGLAARVDEILRASAMPAAQLQLEVTESLAAQGEAVQGHFHELKAMGLTLALDDFGTGYSSLSSLHQIPVDTVKIDRSFVIQAASSLHHRVLIDATIRVAHSLGMTTVAEGIETEEQKHVLRKLGVDKGQGYLFSRPMLSEDLVKWLTSPALQSAAHSR